MGAARLGAAVSGYLASSEEIDPMSAMLTLRAMGHPVCVPVTQRRGMPLRFRSWHPCVPLELGPLGIPVPRQGEWVVPEVLIVPLVAFDRKGYRLGYGGGYYDRTLAELRQAGRVTAVGFAFAAQEVPEVPIGPHDAKLDAIVTELGVVDLC
jgi:5-formyltetrahydrofolate cyclo-ligase